MGKDSYFAEITKRDAEFAERVLHTVGDLLECYDTNLKGLKKKVRVLLSRNIELRKQVKRLEGELENERRVQRV